MRGRGVDPVTGQIEEDAYARTSDLERFAPLHDLARVHTDTLLTRYETELAEVPVEERGRDLHEVVDAWRVVPAAAEASPLTFLLTAFPGVVVRFGRWSEETYPSCGCDACDEDVEDLEPMLAATIEAVVGGGFAESLELRGGLQPWSTTSLTSSLQRGTSGQQLSFARYRELGGAAERRYTAWPPRPQQP